MTGSYELPPELASRVLTPALAVYLDRVRENVAAVIDAVGGCDRWRPHVKTSKIPAVFEELARAGLRQFKCATTREANLLLEALARSGVEQPDVLLAYPLLGPGLARLGDIAAEYESARVSVLCEDADVARAVPDRLGIFVDVNPGMHRTGVPLEDVATILRVARAARDRFAGIHYYDGHLHAEDAEERHSAAFSCYEQLLELLSLLEREGLLVGEVITSGTPTFLDAIAFDGLSDLGSTVHRVSPGTVVYHDQRSEELGLSIPLAPAALVHARIVSHPAPGVATCDAGSKSVAAEAGDPCAAVVGRPDLVARTPNEEHLPLFATGGDRPARGEHVMLFPRHVCPTVNLAEEALLLDGGELVDVVPVSARAHELLP